ncbi:MAG: hypothetical protein IKR22_06085, partial [Clostridiales bacterium]|nr:hypothetical protein [Clostridiales bacterium]
MKKEMYMNRKKILALALSATMIAGGSFALAACKDKSSTSDEKAEADSSENGSEETEKSSKTTSDKNGKTTSGNGS